MGDLLDMNRRENGGRMKDGVKEKLDTFLLLPEGWDSYGSAKFSEKVIAKAKEIADWLPDDGWGVVPCPGGAVQFEKHSDGFDIEIYISQQTGEG